MTSQQIEHIALFEFHNPAYPMGGKGLCDLQIFKRDDRRLVAVISELVTAQGDYAYDGLSVANGIEYIASEIITEIGIHFDYLIEFYPARGYMLDVRLKRGHQPQFPEEFSLVTFGRAWDTSRCLFGTPEWKFFSRAEAEIFIGQPFKLDYLPNKIGET